MLTTSCAGSLTGIVSLNMNRHVFTLRNGDSFWVWNVEFHGREERRETFPRGPEGERGTFSYTVESAHVSFCAAPGTVHIGQWGQLSSAEENSYFVKVSYIELESGHVIVSGDATRTVYHEEHR
jgi:hypothetical protein